MMRPALTGIPPLLSDGSCRRSYGIIPVGRGRNGAPLSWAPRHRSRRGNTRSKRLGGRLVDVHVFATTTCGGRALAGRFEQSGVLSGLYLVSAAGGTLNPFPKGYPNLSSQMITHIAHMDQDQSTDRSGEYLVYGNAADATTFASGMSALGFRSSVQGQVNLGLVASHNPDIIKAYGGMMGGISRPGHGGGVRPDSALRYSPFARSLVAASCQPRNSSCGVRRSHRHRSNGFDQCADPRLLQRFSSMDAMVSLVSPDMDTIRRSTPHSRDRDVGHRMVKRRNPGSGQGSNDQSPGLLRLVSASLSGGHVGDTADSFSHLCHTGTVTL